MSSPKSGRGRDRNSNRSKSPLNRSSFGSSEAPSFSMLNKSQAVISEDMKSKINKLFENVPQEIDFKEGKWAALTLEEIEQNSAAIVDSNLVQWVENVKIEVSGIQGVYTGQFMDMLPHGIGRFVSNDGEVFEGQFLLGKRHDYLRHIQKDGTISIGKWKSDEPIKTTNQKFFE